MYIICTFWCISFSPTDIISPSLDPGSQAILSKQTKLLQRLEELDKEAESLRREVSESARVRDDLATQLQHVQAECSTLRSQLSEQKVNTCTLARSTGLQQHHTTTSTRLFLHQCKRYAVRASFPAAS